MLWTNAAESKLRKVMQMVARQKIYKPKWLTESKYDARTGGNTNAYVTNLKRITREVASVLWEERGGNNILYRKLHDAYFGSDLKNEEQ